MQAKSKNRFGKGKTMLSVKIECPLTYGMARAALGRQWWGGQLAGQRPLSRVPKDNWFGECLMAGHRHNDPGTRVIVAVVAVIIWAREMDH
jgi:hypothetical protein